MKCCKCGRIKHENNLLYTHDTLILHCTECLSEGIPYREFNDFLSINIPELHSLTSKAISTRLGLDQLVYLMKYAHAEGTMTISSTLQAMVNELMESKNLDKEKLLDTPFKTNRVKKRNADVVPSFLRRTNFKREEIKVENPKQEVKPKQDAKTDEPDEDVFTI